MIIKSSHYPSQLYWVHSPQRLALDHSSYNAPSFVTRRRRRASLSSDVAGVFSWSACFRSTLGLTILVDVSGGLSKESSAGDLSSTDRAMCLIVSSSINFST